MRIVIDMQGAQTESRFRGIGRYTMSLAKAIVRNKGKHDVFLVLSGLFPNTIEQIRTTFESLLPQVNIRVWYAPGPVKECEQGNDWRREVAEYLREAFIVSLHPDVILITSLFEGLGDDAVTSVGVFDTNTPTAIILYDLIPLISPDIFYMTSKLHKSYYLRKIESLRRSCCLLAISDYSRREALEMLQYAGKDIVNISTACDALFHVLNLSDSEKDAICKKFNISKPFILYTGGADERKNLKNLISAYAALPIALRNTHQLVLAGKMPESNVLDLRKCVAKHKLAVEEVIFTGYVRDEDLVKLYNSCKLFVFPSLHEGFGLPPLEAMACGAPVIVARATSLPEVISNEEALFDPRNVAEMSSKMTQVLYDEAFRTLLCAHGKKQTRKFSWDATAQLAIAALEKIAVEGSKVNYISRSLAFGRLIQDVVQHLPVSEQPNLLNLACCLAQNQSAGIERQLMVDVSEICKHDSATGVQRVVRSYLKALLKSPPGGFRIEPVYATLTEGYRYARRFTQKFLGQNMGQFTDTPMRWQRGDIFLGLDMQHHVQLANKNFYQQIRLDGVTVKFIVHDLLPIELRSYFKDLNAKVLHEQWLEMIADTDGVICVSKATVTAFRDWIIEAGISIGPNFQMNWVHNGADLCESKPSIGLPADFEMIISQIRSRFSFLCVATIEPRKMQQQILKAIELLWDERIDVNLVLVGQEGWNMETLAENLHNHPEKDRRLFWLQGISDDYLEKLYLSSTCLIAASLNEGFGLPLIEAAHYKIPLLVRDIPVFREIAGDCAFYFTGESPHDLAAAVKNWLRLHQEGQHPKSDKLRWSTWQESAEKLKNALIKENYPRHQLLVDISMLVFCDLKTGIQRVVRSVLKEWLTNPPKGYRVEPVYATMDTGYRYARRFTQRFIGNSQNDVPLHDELIEYAPGDVFFGLDLQPQVVPVHRKLYKELRRQGVLVQFMVYDLLCVEMPQFFEKRNSEDFVRWLEVVSENDGAICISKTTADKLSTWVKKNATTRNRLLKIKWSHIGGDIEKSMSSNGVPFDAERILSSLCRNPSFIMVGTLEPRKGHAQVLDAFEELWRSGLGINLLIVGKKGWMAQDLFKRLYKHPEMNKRLFWLEGISDQFLEMVYTTSTCLISASYGEGFGLPLVEAAQHSLPIIARDIPIFREVAGDHAFYFEGKTPKDLAQSITEWLKLHGAGQHPVSKNMPWLTWKESAAQLTQRILADDSQTSVESKYA